MKTARDGCWSVLNQGSIVGGFSGFFKYRIGFKSAINVVSGLSQMFQILVASDLEKFWHPANRFSGF